MRASGARRVQQCGRCIAAVVGQEWWRRRRVRCEQRSIDGRLRSGASDELRRRLVGAGGGGGVLAVIEAQGRAWLANMGGLMDGWLSGGGGCCVVRVRCAVVGWLRMCCALP